MSARSRAADRARVEATLGLPAQGGPQAFTLPSGAPFAVAYQRVVYGDRGPYVEFTRQDIVTPLVARFGNAVDVLPPRDCGYWWVWLHPVGAPDVRVYWQVRGPLLGMGQRGLFG